MNILEARRPHVRFETKAEAYVDADGHMQHRNKYFVTVTPAGGNGKDQLYQVAEDWLNGLRQKAMNQGSMDSELYMSWHGHFANMFDLFKQGEEMTTDGTPLRACMAFNPAQIAAAESVKIFSLEAMAGASESEITAIGIGGRDMKNKAEKVIEQLSEGRVAEENAALRLKLSQMEERMAELEAAIPAKRGPGRPRQDEAA